MNLGSTLNGWMNIPGSQGTTNAWNQLMDHKDNNNPYSPNFREHDPTSDNYVGPKEAKMSPKVREQIVNKLNDKLANLNGGKGPTNPNGKLTAAEIDEISNAMKTDYQNGSRSDADSTFYNTFHSLPPNSTNFYVKDGEFVSFDSNYVYTDPRDANPMAYDEAKYGNSVISQFVTEMAHGVTEQAISNGVWKDGDPGSPYYLKDINVYGDGPDNTIIGTQYNLSLIHI